MVANQLEYGIPSHRTESAKAMKHILPKAVLVPITKTDSELSQARKEIYWEREAGINHES